MGTTLPTPGRARIGDDPTSAPRVRPVPPLVRAVLGLVVGLLGLLVVVSADAVALDVVGAVAALGGWGVYWVATFRLILARVRGR